MDLLLQTEPEPITIDTDKTALVVVDMQNSFCKKGGMMDHAGKLNEAAAERVISVCQRVISQSRKSNISVFYLRMTYGLEVDADLGPDSPFYWKEKGLEAEKRDPALKERFLAAGSWGWEIVDELKPEPGDTVINKSRYSGFVNTDLEAKLRSGGIKYLLFAGLFSNICVESTLRDAFHREFFPILISDACGPTEGDRIQDATVSNVRNAFGWVTAADDLINSLE